LGCYKSTKKEIDLSLTFRLSGLSQNAKLTLSKRAVSGNQEVNIALQTQKERLVAKFPASTSLWDILKHWEKEKGVNFTTDSDVIPDSKDNVKVYMQPVITYTTKEITTNEDLRAMTLAKLGLIGGSGLLRLCHKFTTVPIEVFLSMDAQNASLQQMARAQEQKLQQEKIESVQREKVEKERFEKQRIEEEKLRVEREIIEQEKVRIEMEKSKNRRRKT